ncbi:MAG TPA: hypothetical protein VE690_04670 [Rhodopila sp.]|nr:hypothetical protein [Rhodopila sp.]
MLRALAITAALVPALAPTPAPALAAEPGPVCRASTVVEVMAREIRAQDYYTQIDPRLITEQATPIPNLVRCNVCVLQTPYEMTRFGQQPIRRCIARTFEVRILRNGFVVGRPR